MLPFDNISTNDKALRPDVVLLAQNIYKLLFRALNMKLLFFLKQKYLMDIVTTYSSFKPCLNKCISFDDNNKLCLSLFKLFLGHQDADIQPEFLNQTSLTLK